MDFAPTAAAYNLIRLRTLLAGREVGRGTAGAPLDRTRQAANLVVTSMVIRSRVKRVALTSFHQPAS